MRLTADRLSGPCPGPSASLQKALVAAAGKGLTIIAAAGNDYHKPVGYPAKYPQCHAVSACDEQGRLTAFSNRGQEIKNIAPGMNVLSCADGNGYKVASGTSMAAPHVTGVAALILQGQTNLGPEAVRAQLKKTAIDLGLPPIEQGGGLVNAVGALRRQP